MSAEVTIAVALVSALTGRAVRGGVAMTGELTLSGALAPVGGIRSKVLAACRVGMAGVILPQANRQDVNESRGGALPPGLDVHYAVTMDDVLEVALPDVLCQRALGNDRFWTEGRPQHVGAYGLASSARASLDERARSRRQGRKPREAGAERSEAP